MSNELQDDNQYKNEVILKPIFPKATEILFYTGNTLAVFKFLKKTNSNVTEEIIEYMSTMLQTMRAETDGKQFEDETYIKLLPTVEENQSAASSGTAAHVSHDNEQLSREDLKYSIKIFLRSLQPDLLRDIINTVLHELKENYLESVLISLPNYGSQLTLKDFMLLWDVVEEFINKQKILSAGVCDFMLPLLSDFYNEANHKPYANQINLGVCCSIPDELNKFVKENNIQLLTHSDPIDILNESNFQQTVREYCHEYDAWNWKPLSVVRFTSVIAKRGIVKTKGYFIYAKRDLRMP